MCASYFSLQCGMRGGRGCRAHLEDEPTVGQRHRHRTSTTQLPQEDSYSRMIIRDATEGASARVRHGDPTARNARFSKRRENVEVFITVVQGRPVRTVSSLKFEYGVCPPSEIDRNRHSTMYTQLSLPHNPPQPSFV